MCTDVAARGLDIPFVANVVHYQCPFNAETYVHRCGRTARINRGGFSLAILNPEDNKSFRGICQSLSKNENSFQLFGVSYNLLEKIRPLIDQAKELEKDIHRKQQGEKSANWVLKQAQQADLDLDDDIQMELHQQLGQKAAKREELQEVDSRLKEFAYDESIHRKRENKQ